jgi:lysylphosphatidylglycerol synthetase-like protein (DUF2156 family)
MTGLDNHLAQISAIVLLSVFPAIFCVGGWFVDRRSRRRHEPVFRRLFALAAYSGCWLVGFVALSILSFALPHYPSTNSALLTISYALGLSWIYLFVLAFFALMACALSGLLVKHLIHRGT